jgi:hypothetical protein
MSPPSTRDCAWRLLVVVRSSLVPSGIVVCSSVGSGTHEKVIGSQGIEKNLLARSGSEPFWRQSEKPFYESMTRPESFLAKAVFKEPADTLFKEPIDAVLPTTAPR